jgi:peptidoglycan/xylan/chitin deacetylase (PgdA/CDA1 family)
MSEVLALCYHAVSEHWPSELAVTPEDLEQQLSLLVERGYRGATFRDAVTAPPAPRTLAVTFDDAYRSVLDVALPILSRLGLPGSVYVVTAFAGSQRPMTWRGIDRWLGTPHEPELTTLGWDELAGLAAEGWEVGSHSHSHPRLTELGDDELAAELLASRQACAQGLGAPCDTIAYPYGDVDERVAEAAGRAGYRVGGTLPGALRGPTPLRWPRVGIYRGDGQRRFRMKVSRGVRALRATPLWRPGGARLARR